jgi:hypothetical protein
MRTASRSASTVKVPVLAKKTPTASDFAGN